MAYPFTVADEATAISCPSPSSSATVKSGAVSMVWQTDEHHVLLQLMVSVGNLHGPQSSCRLFMQRREYASELETEVAAEHLAQQLYFSHRCWRSFSATTVLQPSLLVII